MNYFKQYMVPEPKLENPAIQPRTIILQKPERYRSENNQHHWTTTYVWNRIIPMIVNDFNIGFNGNDWTLIDNWIGDECFSYHSLKNDESCTITLYNNIGIGTEIHTTVNGLRCDAMRCDAISPYHALFVSAHKTCCIVNDNVSNNRCILVNCDSMAIPLIPILAHYFHKIIHLDSRDHTTLTIPNLIDWHTISDYMALFTSMSWNVYNKPQQQLHPYIKSNT